MAIKTKHIKINIQKIKSLESLKKYGTYLTIKRSIEKEIGFKLGGRSWKELYFRITNIVSILKNEKSIIDDILTFEDDFLKTKSKLQNKFQIKIEVKNKRELISKINTFMRFFSYSSPYEKYEKNKKRNFKNSSKLEGIHLPSNQAESSLDEILNKYRENA